MKQISYKVKIEEYQDIHDLKMKLGFKVKKWLSRTDCNLSPADHNYYNSDLFEQLLNIKHKALINNARVLFIDKLPEHIKVTSMGKGFFHIVTIDLPKDFK